MATKTGRVNLFRRHLRQLPDFCHISARFDMRLAWSVAALAGDSLAAVFQCELGVWVESELGGKIGVAGGAHRGPDVAIRRI